MRVALAVIFALLFAAHAGAQGIPLTGAGSGGKGAALSSYVGAGDVQSGAIGYWALRAYSRSYATALSKLANICMPSDTTCADVSSDINGNFNIAGAPSLTCNNSTSVCTVKTLYDQTSNSHDATQATISKRPVLVLNCLGTTKPCMTFSSTAVTSLVGANSVTQAQPWTASAVFNETGADADGNILSNYSTGSAQIFISNGSGNEYFTLYSGSPKIISGAITTSAWHAGVGLASGASSEIVVDGTPFTPLTTGTGAFSGQFAIGDDGAGGDPSINGQMAGVGFWPLGMSAANMVAVSQNEQTYWGF